MKEPKNNVNESTRNEPDRRRFIKTASAAAVGGSIVWRALDPQCRGGGNHDLENPDILAPAVSVLKSSRIGATASSRRPAENWRSSPLAPRTWSVTFSSSTR